MKSLSLIKQTILRLVVKVATFLHLPSDKVLHFLCSAIIMGLCSVFFNPMLSCFVTLAIGLLKELYDCHKSNPTGWDWKDLLADVLGMGIGWMMVCFL